MKSVTFLFCCLAVVLVLLHPVRSFGAAYDPAVRIIPLTKHVSIDDVLDSGLRPRKLSTSSSRDFHVAIGSVRLDFDESKFEFKDYRVSMSFSGTGVMIRMSLQSQGLRDAKTVASWFEEWSRAMKVANPFPEESLRNLSGWEDIGSIRGLFKDFGAYAVGIAPRAVGANPNAVRRYVVDATVVIFANGKSLDLPIIFAPVQPSEKYRHINLEPYSKEELHEIQEVTFSHDEEWLGIPRRQAGDFKKMIEAVRSGELDPQLLEQPQKPNSPQTAQTQKVAERRWLMWGLSGILTIVAVWLLLRKRQKR